MAFSESVKRQVKEKAAFRCCRCQQIGVDVHHIIPQKGGGVDDISNAAPLCQNCHDQFGDNSAKRKEITHMRDWWYERCAQTFPTGTANVYDQINTRIETIQKGQVDLRYEIGDLKTMLKKISDEAIESITPGTAGIIASGIVNTSTAAASSNRLGPRVYANFQCSKCNTTIGLLVGSDNCPECGAQIMPRP